ncbi:hypothetical protein [Helicobacter pylori]|uniref:hypothetical protein n=1 Tax=Helicobacter pylori TaxID=210 RepID=UPI00271214D9|nr:hypothetical protein [Helicobacter pylori]MDO7815222.1 hypothetical protein [Helicobacter pylori]MDO7819653.1 hypothetical protein [Helicobacter pylori]MDO7829053.1 hypothetical protein [Helicobacter pylori]MDO7866156.1 hypothetical protein [Helicobacter pylori]WQU17357.1 hypothetical protein KVD80_06565 [Helicobacter pylori]
MGFNVNQTTTYNGHFNQITSIKPIAGFLNYEMYLNNLATALNSTGNVLLPAQPIALQIGAKQASGLIGLNPDVLNISETPIGTNGVFGGVVIHNITDFVMPGDKAPALRPTQTTYIAEIGSGVEVFLPCDLSFLGQASRQFIAWDKTNQCYTLKTTNMESFGSQKVSLRSNVIEGRQIVFDTNNPTQTIFKDCYVIKVRL